MKILLTLSLFVFFAACQTTKQPDKEVLFKADLEFSAMSAEMGFNKAFIEFAHPNAVLLRENSMPIVGKPAITKLFEKANAEGINFTWEPLDGEISASGELGFTYGIFTIKKDTVMEQGTYISVWKKDESGKWKYILDSGNEGIGNKIKE